MRVQAIRAKLFGDDEDEDEEGGDEGGSGEDGSDSDVSDQDAAPMEIQVNPSTLDMASSAACSACRACFRQCRFQTADCPIWALP